MEPTLTAQQRYNRTDKAKARRRRWYYGNLEKVRARSASDRLKKYGLDEQGYYALLWFQDDACAICRDPFATTPHIDHDHETGTVRGLLCANCNTGIGKLKDDPKVLLAAAAYLNERK